jgi:hypothetical protein
MGSRAMRCGDAATTFSAWRARWAKRWVPEEQRRAAVLHARPSLAR